MISIKYAQIPSYLHSSAFYRTLDSEDAHINIEIPFECFKQDDSITNISDMYRIILVERFWGLDQLPNSLMEYYYRLSDRSWNRHELSVDEFPALFDMWEVFALSKPLNEVMESCKRPELVLFLIEFSPRNDSSATQTAAKLGKLDYLAALYKRGYDWNERTCSAAAEGGHLDCLTFARDNNCPWDEDTMTNAASNGHLHCLQYAWKNRLRWHPLVTSEAARHGHLECLRFALENGCPLHENACWCAAECGHLECLMMLHLYNASWDESVPVAAALSGSLECLQYLHENGCPWDATTTEAAAIAGSAECLNYALSEGCAYDATIIQEAATKGSLACLKCLIEDNGMYMDEDGSLFVVAMKCGNVACLQYLIDAGCPLGDFQPGDEYHDYGYDKVSAWENYATGISDGQLLQCIELAVHYGWRWNGVFVEYVRRNRRGLRHCWVHVNESTY